MHQWLNNKEKGGNDNTKFRIAFNFEVKERKEGVIGNFLFLSLDGRFTHLYFIIIYVYAFCILLCLWVCYLSPLKSQDGVKHERDWVRKCLEGVMQVCALGRRGQEKQGWIGRSLDYSILLRKLQPGQWGTKTIPQGVCILQKQCPCHDQSLVGINLGKHDLGVNLEVLSKGSSWAVS